MTEIRCKKCKRLLMKADSVNGEIKCGKCGMVNFILYPVTTILDQRRKQVYQHDAEKYGMIAVNTFSARIDEEIFQELTK